MPRQRSPEREKARSMWEADRSRPLVSIAAELSVPETMVRKWKCLDKWEQSAKGTLPKAKKERSVSKAAERKLNEKLIAMVEANEALTDKQRTFCLHYVKTFNATRAYQVAFGCSYDVANAEGYKLLVKPCVCNEITRLKAARNLAMMADAEDVVMLHMRIAFADITDYVEFGRVDETVMGVYGPVMVEDPATGGKVPLTRKVNDVRFRESVEVDGRLLSKITRGRNGASVELADRQKSLAFLERYFELNPMDRHRKEYDLARLEMERKKQGDDGDHEDDGFAEALSNSVREVWTDEEQGDLPV